MSELEEILRAFGALVQEHEEHTEVEDDEEDAENFRCTDCIDCRTCRFCTSCERCTSCTYCDACSDCADCTQSRECLACADCSQSNLCAYCERSSYLTLCLDCEGCVQCFACVGLSDAEFCILNKPYKRSVYFKKVAELRTLLDAKLTEGWMPPWSTPHEETPEVLRVQEDPALEPELEPSREPSLPHETGEPSLADDRAALVATTDAQRLPRDAPEHTEPSSVEVAAVARPNDATAVLDVSDSPPVVENTGSWPPVDHHSAREMDRGPRSPAPWEDLFAPDELPPPRPAKPARADVHKPEPAPSESAPTPEPEAPRAAPQRRETDRLPAGEEKTGASRWSGALPSRSRWDRAPEPKAARAAPGSGSESSSTPPPGFLGELPRPEREPDAPDPKRPSVRRVRRPDDS